MNRLALVLLGMTMMSFLFSSCIKEEIRLSRYHRKIVDSLAQLQTSVLRENMDSICDIRLAREVQAHTDSIVQVRLQEIREKIELENVNN